MRRPLVIGNWKMNGSRDSVTALVERLARGAAAVTAADIAVCPPFVYLPQVVQALQGSQLTCGAQNLAEQEFGAYTGEISGSMLAECGCRYVLVGHSERRTLYAESDEVVAHKFAATQRHQLIPVLCVGETLNEREEDATQEVIARQIDAIVAVQGVAALAQAVIAYEPVWAIGTGRTATPEQAAEVHQFIRARIAEQDADIAARTRILYGGSVKGASAAELFKMEDIDGGLIGGASLNAEEFLTICTAAAAVD